MKANTPFKTVSPPFSPLQTPAAPQPKSVPTVKQNRFPSPLQKVHRHAVGMEMFRSCRCETLPTAEHPIHIEHANAPPTELRVPS